MKKTRVIVTLGLLVALNILLSRFFSVQPTPFLRINFGFLAVAAAGLLFGPLAGGAAAAVADVLGYFIFPSGGAYFPGITVSALLAGIIYGLFLHRQRPSLIRCLLAAAAVCLFVDAGLTTFWLTLILPGKTFAVLFWPRLIKSLVAIPVQSVMLFVFWQMLERVRPIVSR